MSTHKMCCHGDEKYKYILIEKVPLISIAMAEKYIFYKGL